MDPQQIAETAAPAAMDTAQRADFLQHYVWGHILNGHYWHLPGYSMHLPSPLTVHVLMMLIASAILILLCCVLIERRHDVAPSGIANIVESFVIFIRDDISIPSMGEEDGRRMTPLFCSFFFFVLCLNLMGLFPLFVTATGNLNVTAGLSLITFVIMIGGALMKNGPVGLFKAFVPSGVPLPLLFLFVPLEIIGVFIKTFALTIRLFANMLAGHIVVLFLLGFMILFGIWGLPAIGMALFILLIEILVCFLQAYIFTLLSAVFIGLVHHPSH